MRVEIIGPLSLAYVRRVSCQRDADSAHCVLLRRNAAPMTRVLTAVGAFVLTIGVGLGAGPYRSASAASACDSSAVKRVDLITADGITVAGFVQGPASATAETLSVVLVHQVNGDHCGWAAEAAHLAKTNTVLSLDLRGYGASQSASGTAALMYRKDIEAAVQYLRTQRATKVVLIGASMGGSAVVVAGAAIKPPVDAVVTVSAPGNFNGQNATANISKLTMPLRVMAASDDGGATAGAKRLLAKAKASADAASFLYAKGGHGWALLRPGTVAQSQVDGFLQSIKR